MSLQILSALFSKTINPEKTSDIKQAEQQLSQFLNQPEFMQALMILSNDQQEQIQIRQAAAAHLKLIIQRHWNLEVQVFSESDKIQVKDNVLQALVICLHTPQIKNIYSAIIEKLASYDFPKKWPNVINQITMKIQNPQTQNDFIAGLFMFCHIAKSFKLYSGDDRQEIDPVINQVLPIISACAKQILTQQNNLDALKIILKTIYSLVMLNLPIYFNDSSNLQFWMEVLFNIMNTQLPLHLTQKNQQQQDEREKDISWKIKIKAAQILQRFIYKIKQADKKDGFEKLFLEKYSLSFLEIFVKILDTLQQNFVPEKMVFTALRYVFASISIKTLFKVTQPVFLKFLTSICLPMMKIQKEDIELCKTDQVEYIRKNETYFYNSVSVAQDIIQSVCGKKDADNKPFIFSFLKYLIDNLNTQNFIEKDVFMHGLGIVSENVQKSLKKNSQFNKQDLERVLQQFIIPELKGSNQFLRARACWVISKYEFINFQDKNNIVQTVQSVCQCILDSELHVRIHASVTINHLLSLDQAVEMLRPEISNILTTYVKLMNQIDNEGVVLALEGIVQKFQKEVSPYALDLIIQLGNAFQCYAKKSIENFEKNDDNYDGQTEMTAASCLTTIRTILNGQLDISLYPQIAKSLLQVFNYVFSNEGCDYIEEGAEILNQILYHSKTIDINLWFYYPALCYLLLSTPKNMLSYNLSNLNQDQIKILADCQDAWGQDYVEQVVPILKNFIQKGIDQILSEKDFFNNQLFELLFALVDKFQTISQNGSGYENLSQIYSLLIALIENGLQKIDFLFERILLIILNNLFSQKIYEQMIKFEVLSACFYYNSNLVFTFLEKQQQCEQVFKIWFQILPKLKFDYQKTRCLYAFSSILKSQKIPLFLQQEIGLFLNQIVKLTDDILENREKDNQEFSDESSEKDDDEEDMNQLDELLEIKGKKIDLGKFDNKDLQEDEAIIDDGSEDQYRDEIAYDSPLDKNCEILFLRSVLDHIQQNNKDFYNIIVSNINLENQQKLQNNFIEAQKQDIEYQKSKQE